MRILHITNHLNAGGVERLLSDLLPIFNQKNNIQVDLMLLESKQEDLFLKKLKNKNIGIFYSTVSKRLSIKKIIEIRNIARKYDVIHTHLFPSQYYLPIINLFLKKKLILITTEHNTDNNRRKYKVLSHIERWIYSKYNKIISISRETEENLLKWLKKEKDEKFVVIENGIKIQEFSKERFIEDSFFKKEREKRIITMVGRFNIQKDQPTLIKAMKYIDNSILFLVGAGEREEEYKKLVKELNLEEKIKFLGVRNDIEKILKITKILVLSSNYEGFGLAAIEAMATGIPVIISNVEGLKQVVGDSGIIFENGNYNDLANKINYLLSNKNLYKELKEKCLKRSMKYDISKMVDKYLQIYLKYRNEGKND